jgi:hypothetical protein
LELHQDDANWTPATWFFNAVGTATTRILALFKELERDDEIRYWELLRQCFRNTDFFDQVGTIAQFPRRPEPQLAPRGGLLDGGYNLFDIDDLQQHTDNEEVEVLFYQMLQTPENLLRALAKRFLVFGLSATADLPRCVHHFDLDWLGDQELLLPTTDLDRADIEAMSREKAERRHSQMTIAEVDQLDVTDPFQAKLQQFLEAVAHNDEFDEDTAGGHRSQRMHRFFAALLWLFAHGGDQARQLLFLNTFRQVRLLFTKFATHAADAGVFTVERLPGNQWFDAFRLTISTDPIRQATIVFFNAALAAEVRQSQEAERTFAELFWTDEPVVVVTQYLSAGNGVTLQYTNDKDGPTRDFTSIGLLEAPYFFFAKPDPEEMSSEEIFAAHKGNIWYQAKLYYSRQISEARFKQALGTLTRPGEWNARYRTGSTSTDCLFNQLAIFIQALGRVERVWEATPDQVALLTPEVFRVFQAFIGPEFETIRLERAPFASANLHSVLEAVADRSAGHLREARRQRDTRLRAANERCREQIRVLVTRLEAVRTSGDDQEARRDWEELRRAVLRHDFHAGAVETYACATSSPYLSRGRLNLTPDLDVLPVGLPHPDSHVIHLDALYSVIAQNLIVRDHFLASGYDLRFDHPGFEIFTPYCLQSILAGAIGEEAITALLAHAGFSCEPMPDDLFEITDLKLAGRPWFIDAKNYSEQTLDRFSLPLDDPLWHPTLNETHFKQHALHKLERIVRTAGPDGKLIYINLVSSQPRLLGYYNHDFEEIASFDDAAIVVVQGALDRDEPNRYQDAFTVFLADLRRVYHSAEDNPVDADGHEDAVCLRDLSGQELVGERTLVTRVPGNRIGESEAE